jgi:hypothetical protein
VRLGEFLLRFVVGYSKVGERNVPVVLERHLDRGGKSKTHGGRILPYFCD